MADLLIPFEVINVLQAAMEFPDLVRATYATWRVFVHNLDVCKIGPILDRIVVELLSGVSQSEPKELNENILPILHFLIITHRRQLQPHFPNLFFIPKRDEFSDILGM